MTDEMKAAWTKFQSTPSAWRETVVRIFQFRLWNISIHSLRMEGDPMWVRSSRTQSYFNPLPPHGGRLSLGSRIMMRCYFNPLPPHGGRPHDVIELCQCGICISIHSLRMEGDFLVRRPNIHLQHFNPLPPHGGRPLRASHNRLTTYFNPLPPHGGRQTQCVKKHAISVFQSTPSAWRETWLQPCAGNDNRISIHSLRMEGDAYRRIQHCQQMNFNPLPPHGGRHVKMDFTRSCITFQSTPSAWRETPNVFVRVQIPLHFNPLPPHGGRLLPNPITHMLR